MRLNKSLSLSQMPSTKELQEEQKFSERNKILKHFSCEQLSLCGKQVKFQRTVQEFSVSDDNNQTLKSWAFKFEGPCSALNMRISPKENTGIKSNDMALLEKKNKRKKSKNNRSIINEQQQYKKEKKPIRNILFVALSLIVVFVAIFAIGSMQLASYRRICEMKLNVQELKFTLQRTVYGQESAISEITHELNVFSDIKETQIKILAFVGGIGVGKSYTASIISTNFLWDSNVQEFVMQVHKTLSAEEISASFSLCGDNLVVLDDLKSKDTEFIAKFLQNLAKYNSNRGTRVIVVLVFTTKNDDSEEISHIFQAARLPVSVIEFQSIQREIVEMCIEESLFNKGVIWNKDEVQKILELLPENTGCKGVSSKVNIVTAPETMQQIQDI